MKLSVDNGSYAPFQRSYIAFLLLALLLAFSDCGTEPSSRDVPGQQVAHSDLQQIDSLYQQALARTRDRSFQAAARTFEQVLQLDSTHYEARVGLGEFYMGMEETEKARYHLGKAYRQDPHRIEARFQLAQTHYRAGNALCVGIPTKSSNKQIARQMLTEIVADYPRHILSRMMLAEVWMMVPPPDAELALAQYDTLLKLAPGYR